MRSAVQSTSQSPSLFFLPYTFFFTLPSSSSYFVPFTLLSPFYHSDCSRRACLCMIFTQTVMPVLLLLFIASGKGRTCSVDCTIQRCAMWYSAGHNFLPANANATICKNNKTKTND
ncbi:hypothetical protein BKA57DRAFT_471195 [Linnemannia elongata]|nr:hypothetical protein BKA57DRAFT_471195 [Linnemannia elongata]